MDNKTKKELSVFAEGQQAGMYGRPATSCPYTDIATHAAWYRGFRTSNPPEALTPAQHKWLRRVNMEGFVSRGNWRNGRRNVPLRKLADLGLGWGPLDSRLKCDGFLKLEGNE